MEKRYIVAGAVAAGALFMLKASSDWRRADVEFTRPALPAPARVDLRGDLSTVHVGIPVDLGPVAQRAEAALPAKLANVVEWLADAACAKRTQWVECNSAKMEGTITRTGPVELQIESSTAQLRVPIKYELAATGIGWANNLTESKSGDFVLTVPFSIGLGAAQGLEVAARDALQASDGQITLLKSTIKLARLLEPRVKPAVKAAEDELRKSLAQVPVRAALQRAWTALNQPLELGQGSGLWLAATPEHYSSGGFISADGRTHYRIAIATRLTVAEAERGTPSTSRRSQPVPSQSPQPPGPARVRMAVGVDLEAIGQAAEATFASGETIESRADRFTEPVKVKVRRTRVYPAQRQIGLELDLDVTTHKGATYSGKAHLVGRPVLDPATGTVTVTDVSFPAVSGGDAKRAKPEGVPRLGTEPFASKFAAAAKLDVARTLKDALPRASHMLNQRLGKDLVLTARLSEAVPASLELARDGAYLLLDLTGELTLVYDGALEPGAPDIAHAEPAKDAGGAATATPSSSVAKASAPPQSKHSPRPKRQQEGHPPQVSVPSRT